MIMKSSVLKYFFTIIVVVLFVYIAIVINFCYISEWIIGEGFEYDIDSDKGSSSLFNLFYTISSDTGYIPDISCFNFCFTIVVGVVLGFLISRKIIWRKGK